jgi:hypothetical protein
MFEKSVVFDEKVILKRDLHAIRRLMHDKIQMVCSGSNALVEVSGSFDDGSNYKSDQAECFEDRYYDTLSTDAITMTCGDYSNYDITMRINKESISLSVKGRDRQWLGQTIEEMSQLVKSFSGINYDGSFFFKYYPIRIILQLLQILSLMLTLLYIYYKIYGKSNPQYSVVVIMFLLFLQTTLFLKLESKIPSFRKLWPRIEFDFGPNDKKITSLRKAKAVPIDNRVKWMTTVLLIPLLIALVSLI